jgi:two-component system, cell cycle sensor histidine kinase and response regulator CckA
LGVIIVKIIVSLEICTLDINLYRTMFDNAPVGAIVVETSLDGRCRWLNEQFTRITGYTLEDLPTVRDWIERAYPDPEYRARVLGNWERDVSRESMGRDVVYRVRCADGLDRELLLRASLLCDGEMIVMAVDLSEQRRAERELRESEARYRQLVERSPLGVLVHSEGRCVYINQKACDILGASGPDDMVGKEVQPFVHREHRERVAARIRGVYEGGSDPAPTLVPLIRVDGGEVETEMSPAATTWSGRPAAQVVFADVTDRRRAEREREALDERIRRAQKNESLAVLAGGVAHDFNNLLVGILGNAELAMMDVGAGSSARENLVEVAHTARRAADLAQQMLVYAGKGRLELTHVDLSELVRDIFHLLEVTISHRARLHRVFSSDTPPVRADATQLRQLVMNLITNAAEAIGERDGLIEVCTGRLAREELPGEYAHELDCDPAKGCAFLEVRDSGCGMDAATRERIFDPFFTTKFTGRGLGLAAALGIVSGHGGVIQVESEPGAGSLFRVILPEVEEPRREADTVRKAPGKDLCCSGTVLLVDDDDDTVREVAARMLEHFGLIVIPVGDGQSAVEVYKKRAAEIDLALIDLAMPDLDGYEVIERIRGIDPLARVLISSGFGKQDAVGRFPRGQAPPFVQKPFRFETLAAAVREVLES